MNYKFCKYKKQLGKLIDNSFCSYLLGFMDTVSISETIEAGQGNCVQLFTCTTGPIHGNLFWYAQFSNGSEIRFARNDGGNAETNPPYNEITLEGVIDYHTIVSRGIMDGNLFTNFNSTLSFDISHLIQYNLTSISCGSINVNSSVRSPQMALFDG